MKIFIVNYYYPTDVLGGSEIQCDLLSKYLAKKGHQTYYVAVESLKNKQKEKGDGFEICFLSQKNKKAIKILINFYKLLKKEKPDICYIRIFKYLFVFSIISKIIGIPVVFNTSNIRDTNPFVKINKINFNPIKFLKSIRIIIQQYLNFLTLKRVNVITLNKNQAEFIKNKYKIMATPIYNSMEDNYEQNRISKKNQIIWVNNIKEHKKPEFFLELAKKLKDTNYTLLMIGYMIDVSYEKMINETEKENKNFKYMGGLSHHNVDKILAESKIFVHTCEPEGFGNNFIQAWYNECSTVTLNFDPDDIVKKNNLGYHSGNLEKMEEDIRILINDEKLQEDMGRRARNYALANHNIERNSALYEEYFKKILNKHEQKNK